MTAKSLPQRRFGRQVCILCLNGRSQARAKQTLGFRSNFSTSSCANASTPGAAHDDENLSARSGSAGPLPGPKRFGGFARQQRREVEDGRDDAIDWGDRKERTAFASSAPPPIRSPRLDSKEADTKRQSRYPPFSRISYAQQPPSQDQRLPFQDRNAHDTKRETPAHEKSYPFKSNVKPSLAAQARGRTANAEDSQPTNGFQSNHASVLPAKGEHSGGKAPQQTPRIEAVVTPGSSREEDVLISTFRRESTARGRERKANTNTYMADESDEVPARMRTVDERKRGKEGKGDRRAQKFANVEEDEDDMFDLDEDGTLEERREQRRQKKAQRRADRQTARSTIILPPFISVQSLATALKVRPEQFVKKLEELGFEEIAMDHVLNGENASLVAMEYGLDPFVDRSEAEDVKAQPLPADMSNFPLRPPIVTIMGHVDHGKTTLLDYLRKSSVAASEHGGITQHIGAFSVPIASSANRVVTFLDTPGHAAFLTMRQRGANVTDIVVLVVAADDSVKPQTIEAIRHAKAAGVQIIVAITKVDKESADPQRVKNDLIQHDIEVEEYGGSIQAVEVSGKTGQGVADLEEAIMTLADVLEMRADHDGAPEGWVLEASTKKSGRTATVLVRRGTLRTGDVVVAGTTWARVRSLFNEAGVRVDEASPGTPVEVEGWREQPAAGDEVLGVPSEAKANDVVSFREAREERVQASVDVDAVNESRRVEAERHAAEKLAAEEAAENARAALGYRRRGTYKAVFEAAKAARTEAGRAFREAAQDDTPKLYVIVKADVGGSAEAVVGGIQALPLARYSFAVDVLRTGVGHVSENDIAYAAAVPAGSGFIINFNQDLPPAMAGLAERSGVRILDSNIIYQVIDDVRAAVEERLPPVITTRVLGEADALQAFELRGANRVVNRIAGCRVKNGTIGRNGLVRVFRGGVGGEIVFDGGLASLKNVKKDVMEMRKGSECGIAFDGWDAFEPGDVIQCYEETRETRRLV